MWQRKSTIPPGKFQQSNPFSPLEVELRQLVHVCTIPRHKKNLPNTLSKIQEEKYRYKQNSVKEVMGKTWPTQIYPLSTTTPTIGIEGCSAEGGN